jgi:hypothetical protein
MKKLSTLLAVACILTIHTFNARAQEPQTPKPKAPRLTMDNFDNGRIVPPSKRNSSITPIKSGDSVSGSFVNIDPRAVLEKAFAQLEKVKSMRTRLTISSQSEERETLIEMIRPNRVRVSASGMEMITVGSTAYFKLNDEPWQKTSNPVLAESLNQKDLIKMMLNTEGVSVSGWAIGEEVIAGAPTVVYDITIDERVSSQMPTSGTIRMWIGKNDDLPRKMEFGAPAVGLKMSVSYEDFNKNIVINPPRM